MISCMRFFPFFQLDSSKGRVCQHMSIIVGQHYLTHPVNFLYGKKPEYLEEARDFRQIILFHISTVLKSH